MSDRPHPARHWLRPLKGGDIEFYARANGQTISGRAPTDEARRFLIARFEEWAGVTLPAPEHRAPRR